MKNSLIKLINFSIKGDERGSLIALENNKNIPFDIRRVYYLFDTKNNVKRGFHSHKKLKQILIAVAGSCRVKLDDRKKQESVILDKPNKGLFIEPYIWHEMDLFSSDCVLLVLADDFYNESDYIRNYQEFLNLKS